MSGMNFFGRFLNLNKKGQLFNALLHRTGNAVSDITAEAQIGYSNTSQRVVYFDGTALREIVDKSYVDALAAAGTAPPLPFDASVETTFPATNAKYVVTVAGTVQGVSLDVQDQLFAKTATPTAVATDWWILQGNIDKATQAEVDGGTDNNKYVTPLTAFGTFVKKGYNELIDALSIVNNFGGIDSVFNFGGGNGFDVSIEAATTQNILKLDGTSAILGCIDSPNNTGVGIEVTANGVKYATGSSLNPPSYEDLEVDGLVSKMMLQSLTEGKKYKVTYTTFPMGSAEMVMHNLNLADATDCVIQAWVGFEPANVEIVAIDGNSFTMRSETALNNLKVVVLGL